MVYFLFPLKWWQFQARPVFSRSQMLLPLCDEVILAMIVATTTSKNELLSFFKPKSNLHQDFLAEKLMCLQVMASIHATTTRYARYFNPQAYMFAKGFESSTKFVLRGFLSLRLQIHTLIIMFRCSKSTKDLARGFIDWPYKRVIICTSY